MRYAVRSALLVALLALVPARAYAQITVVAGESFGPGSSFSGSATWTITPTVAPTTDNLLVVMFTMVATNRTITAIQTDNATAFTHITGSPTGNGVNTMAMAYVKVPAGMTSFSITLNSTSAATAQAFVYELTGQHDLAPFDTATVNTVTSAGTSHPATDITTSEADEFIISVAMGSPGVWFADSALTNEINENVASTYGVAGTQAAATATTYSYAHATSGNETSIIMTAAFKQAGGGGDPPDPPSTAPKLLLLGVGGAR